jgi:hypothetical protein
MVIEREREREKENPAYRNFVGIDVFIDVYQGCCSPGSRGAQTR